MPANFSDLVISKLAVIFVADDLIFFLLLAVPGLWLRGRRLWAFKTVVAMAIALALAELLKHHFYSPRPFAAGGFAPLIPHEPDGSFPSSHTAVLAALAASLFLLDKKWGGGFFLLALLVGFGRVLAGVHYWVDILGGMTLGILVAPVVHWLETYFIKKY